MARVVQVRESELQAWAAISERHIAIEAAARAHVREMDRAVLSSRSLATLEQLRRALALRPRP